MVSPQIVGTIQILTGMGALAFLKPAYENRGTPGSTGFGIFTAAVGVYALATGANLVTANYPVSLFLTQLVVASGVLTGAAWLFLALEMAESLTLTRRLIGGFALYIIVAWLVTWLNPGNLVIGPGHELIGTQLDPDYQLGFWVLLGLGYLYILLGTGVFAVESLNATGIRRRQTALLALAIIPALAASIVNAIVQAGSGLPYDYTVFGWAGTLLMFAVALYSGRFLDISALARRVAMGNMHDAMVTFDDQKRLVDSNTTAREVFPVDEEYVGLPAAECFDNLEPNPLAEITDELDADRELIVKTSDEQRYFSVSHTPISDAVGQGHVLVFHDVTAQKQRKMELERQNEQLEAFAEVISHDLRNPLEVARGSVELAETTGETEHFDRIRDAHSRIEAIVDDMLTLARAGQTVQDTRPISVPKATKQAWDTVETTNCTLSLDIPSDLTIQADRDRFLHIFENLFRNAVEHNGQPVTVRVGLLEQPTSKTDSIGLVVEDDGSGLATSDSERIFEQGYTTRDEGTGLGLSIVQEIAEAHGWSITVAEGGMSGVRFEITEIELVEC